MKSTMKNKLYQTETKLDIKLNSQVRIDVNGGDAPKYVFIGYHKRPPDSKSISRQICPCYVGLFENFWDQIDIGDRFHYIISRYIRYAHINKQNY